MKFYLLILSIFAASAFNASFAAASGNFTPKTHENWSTAKQENYSLQYPKEWTLKKTENDGISLTIPGSTANVGLTIIPLEGEEIAADKFVGLTMEEMKGAFKDLKVVESKAIPGQYKDGYKTVFTGVMEEVKIKEELFIWMFKGKVWMITFAAQPAEFDKLQHTVIDLTETLNIHK